MSEKRNTKPAAKVARAKSSTAEKPGKNSSSTETAPGVLAAADMARTKGTALWRTIAETISDQIDAGDYAPGERLPTETQLAAAFGVNRHTLRRSLAELARQGLVNATPRRGTFVTSSRIDYPIGATTRFSENILASGRDPGGEVMATRETTAPVDMAKWLGIAERSPVVELEMLRLANGEPVCWSHHWFPADRFRRLPGLVERLGSIVKAFEHVGVRRHRRLRSRINARRASARERSMLNLERGDSVLVVEALNVDADGEPIQATVSIFAAKLVQIIVDTKIDQ